MAKPWVLTRQAEAALKDIAVWTVETFGKRQADAYAEDLIEKCQTLADGTAPSKDCRRMVDQALPEDLRYVSHPGRWYGCFLNRSGFNVYQSFIAFKGVLLPKADWGSCWL